MAPPTLSDAGELLGHLLDHLQEISAVQAEWAGQDGHQQPWGHRES